MKTTTGINFDDAKIIEVIGVESYGVVKSRNFVSDVGAGLKSLVGGKIGAYSDLLNDTRREVLAQLEKNASEKGANGLIGIGFATSEVGHDMLEILVYGTAVVIEENKK